MPTVDIIKQTNRFSKKSRQKFKGKRIIDNKASEKESDYFTHEFLLFSKVTFLCIWKGMHPTFTLLDIEGNIHQPKTNLSDNQITL